MKRLVTDDELKSAFIESMPLNNAHVKINLPEGCHLPTRKPCLCVVPNLAG